MTLDAWIQAEGVRAVQRLSQRSGVSIPAIYRARERRAQLATATKLHLATDCVVPISSMTGDAVPAELEPRKRARRS